jgi:deoxycytidylate deaminase
MMHHETTRRLAGLLLGEVTRIRKWAETATLGCKRKNVGCTIFSVNDYGQVIQVCFTHNGPSKKAECSNVVGGCGCSHAEPRAMLECYRKGYLPRTFSAKLVMVCLYSPCTNCANIINDAGIIDAVVYDILTQHDTRGRDILNCDVIDTNLLAENHNVLAHWF